MTAPGVVRSGVGFRSVQLLALNTDGRPAATDTSAYAGVQVTGARGLSINDPEPQQIVHSGDDRPFALDVLPPTEPISGELTVGKTNDTVDALLSDDAAFTVGEAPMFAIGSDSRGDENQVAILCYRQTLDTDASSANFGDRRWEFRVFPKVFLISREGGLTADPEERMYTVRPQFITAHLWGTSLSTSTEGCEQAQGFRGISQYKPRIVSWQGDNSETTFNLEATYPAQSTDKIAIWVDGVLQTADITKATDSVQFTTAPTTDADVVAFYEHNV